MKTQRPLKFKATPTLPHRREANMRRISPPPIHRLAAEAHTTASRKHAGSRPAQTQHTAHARARVCAYVALWRIVRICSVPLKCAFLTMPRACCVCGVCCVCARVRACAWPVCTVRKADSPLARSLYMNCLQRHIPTEHS